MVNQATTTEDLHRSPNDSKTNKNSKVQDYLDKYIDSFSNSAEDNSESFSDTNSIHTESSDNENNVYLNDEDYDSTNEHPVSQEKINAEKINNENNMETDIIINNFSFSDEVNNAMQNNNTNTHPVSITNSIGELSQPLNKINEILISDESSLQFQSKQLDKYHQNITISEAAIMIWKMLEIIAISSLKDLTLTTAAYHSIKIQPGVQPIKQKERRIAYHYKIEFEQMMKDMLEAGRIRESRSAWASPLRLLKKKDGTLRTTIDYKLVNNVIEKEIYPIPMIDDIFSRLAKAKYFTVLDLTSGYYQVPLDPNSSKYTAFICYLRLFEYLVLPMGITNATSTFQRMMNKVLNGLLYKICEVYLDDIIIYSNTLEEHINHVKQVIDRLKEYNLKIKISKCKIAQESVEYLSHIISNGTIQPSPRKIQELLKYQTPFNAKQILSFHGLGSYYRRFIGGFATIVAPLLRAIEGKTVVWNEECELAVNILKKLLTTCPILRLPIFTQPFRVETDASNYGAGGVLTQMYNDFWHPVAYFSKHLTKTERNYSTSERELFAIVLTVEHFKQFLYGVEFVVITDHKPLKYLLTTKEPSSRLLRWINRLSMFNYRIEYRKGTKNGNADALSRLCTEPDDDEDRESVEPAIINFIVSYSKQLNEQQLQDPNLKWLYDLKMRAKLENKYTLTSIKLENKQQRSLFAQWNRIFVINETLYRAWYSPNDKQQLILFQYVLPLQQIDEILKIAHDPAFSGHTGINKTTNRIKNRYYWPGWEQDVKNYVKSCETCQRVKGITYKNDAPLIPIQSLKPFQIINADIMGPFPISKHHNKSILIIVDHFTKWVQLFALKNTNAINVAKCLLKFISANGIPDQILTDQGSNFQSQVLSELYDLLDIHRSRTTAYHPQCDGLAERYVRTFKTAIACFVNENHRNWDEHLDLLAFAFNTATQETTGFSPFFLNHGREPKIPLDLFHTNVNNQLELSNDCYAEHIQQILKKAFEVVTNNIDRKMDQAKIRHDRNIRASEFKTGELVWLKVESNKPGLAQGLTQKWVGPYTVLERHENNVDYVIKNKNIDGKRRLVHRSKLKKCFARHYKTHSPNQVAPPNDINSENSSLSPKSQSSPQISLEPKNSIRRSRRLAGKQPLPQDFEET